MAFTPKIEPPSHLLLEDGREENFHSFQSQWKTFFILTELDQREAVYQHAFFKYCVGPEATKVIESASDYVADASTPDEMLTILEQYCIGERNIIHERFVFNSLRQSATEPFDSFYTNLRAQAKRCQYTTMTDELIRDRIVLGVHGDDLRKKLISTGNKLTLDQALRFCRAQEVAGNAMREFSTSSTTSISTAKSVAAVNAKKYRPKPKPRTSLANITPNSSSSTTRPCQWCGRESHPRDKCPAKDAQCNKCKKKGHFANVCRSQPSKSSTFSRSTNEVNARESSPKLFTGELAVDSLSSQNEWTVTLDVNSHTLNLKLDSGADATIISASEPLVQEAELQPTKTELVGPANQPITCFGTFQANLTYKDKSWLETVYVVPNQTRNLLSRTACSQLNLLTCNVDSLANTTDTDYRSEYSSLFTGLGTLKSYAYKIALCDDVTPKCIYSARTVPHPLRPKVKSALKEMVDIGVISPVHESTDWCSGMVVVPKPDNTVRICVDLTHLNSAVKREIHPMKSVDESLAQLGSSTTFSKLDANSGFWQIPLDDSSRLLTTFLTSEGRYCFNRLPFGISSAPEIYQRCMTDLLTGLDGIVCHMDDILVHGKTKAEHDRRLRDVLDRMKNSGLTLNERKCLFGVNSVKFLGHIIDNNGLHPDPKKTAAIQNFPTPQNRTELRQFNGLLNQLSKFVPRLSTLTAPVRELLKDQHEWCWDTPQDEAFTRIKQAITSPQILAHYDPTLPTVISSDASQTGIGAALYQIHADSTRRPVCFASKSLNDTEKRYAVIEKEALAATWACERFNEYVYGLRDLTLEVDHKPLVPLFTTTNLDKMPARVLRFRLRIMKYSPKVIHVPGSQHHVADALSRATTGSCVDANDELLINEVEAFVSHYLPNHNYLDKIRDAQHSDPVCAKVIEFCSTGWPTYKSDHPSLIPYFEHQNHITVSDRLLLYDDRLVIPTGLQLEMLRLIHEGHQGIVKCRARARRDVWWPGLSTEIAALVSRCLECKKTQPVPVETLAPSALPERPWERLGMDLFEYNGHNYLIVVDYYSRWIEAILMKSTTCKSTIHVLQTLFSTHGYPDVIISDNGPQFAAHEFSLFAEQHNFTHITSSPKYPKANGEAERAVGTIKRLLTKTNDLCTVLLNYRTTPLQNGYTPAELLMGRQLRHKIPCIPDHLKPILPNTERVSHDAQRRNQQNKTNHDRRHRATDLDDLLPGDSVYMPEFDANATVTAKVAPRSYNVTADDRDQSYRRNRSALIKVEPDTNSVDTDADHDTPVNPVPNRPVRNKRPPNYLNDYVR